MKFNKWTLALAGVGAVSLTSVARAEEQMNAVQTALQSTVISGYVDVSAQWNMGTQSRGFDQGGYPGYSFGGADKADGFNLNVVQLSIGRALDESEWAAGYQVDLWFGPDANALATASTFHTQGYELDPDEGASADFAIRNAYVALRTPIGNGIDWKLGVFDTVIGYESSASGNNPNFTRSWGYSIEPTTHTGILGTYRVCDHLSVSAGIANTKGPHINARAHGEDGKAESFKTYMASLAVTAPDDWGFLAGSTLYGGVVTGFDDNEAGVDWDDNSTSWYAGVTLATPVAGLKLGGAFDYLDIHDVDGETWTLGGYASYQATEKLSLHARGEYLRDRGDQMNLGGPERVLSGTLTAQYDLWQNVISRLEFRWDHAADGSGYWGVNEGLKNSYILAANVIYNF